MGVYHNIYSDFHIFREMQLGEEHFCANVGVSRFENVAEDTGEKRF